MTAGNNAGFSVRASGTAPLSYQWQLNSSNIAGATASGYTFTSAWSQSGNVYSVTITDGNGLSTTSTPATLTVNLPAELGSLKGKLVFLRNDPRKGAYSGTLYLYDFKSKALTPLSPGWSSVFYPKNAGFSSDGSLLTFSAYVDAAASEEDMYVWTVGSAQPPMDITAGSQKRNEDPKFAPADKRLVFKQNGDIILRDLQGNLHNLTNDNGSPEASQPYFMPDGQRIVFSVLKTAGAPSSAAIKMLTVSPSGQVISGSSQLMNDPGVEEYYPIAWGAGQFLFTRWVSVSNTNDVLYSYSFDTGIESNLIFNQMGCNNSDPFPADNQNTLVFYANNCPGGAGGYDLYIASNASGNIYPLTILDPEFATALDEYAPTYWPGQ